MKSRLSETLDSIGNEYRDVISENAENYIETDIGKRAEEMGYQELKLKYDQVNAIVPIMHPVNGMKVRIDGRTFAGYAQLDSGIAVPVYVADDAGLPYKTFVPNDSMILNCV